MRVVATIEDPGVIRRILAHLQRRTARVDEAILGVYLSGGSYRRRRAPARLAGR